MRYDTKKIKISKVKEIKAQMSLTEEEETVLFHASVKVLDTFMGIIKRNFGDND